MGEEGLAGLSLRDLARRAGITTPTVYAYFDSKNAIYDAMFGQAATQFAERMAEPYDCDDPRDLLVAGVQRFFEFCTSDPARYQLLFQRTLPGFEPSPESYAPAVRALADAREWLALNGITEPRHVDMWTALVTGLVDQQVSNDPGATVGPASSTNRSPCSSPTVSARRVKPNPAHSSQRSPIMTMTTIDVATIEPLTHHEAMRRQATSWSAPSRCSDRSTTQRGPPPTDCPAWDIRAMYQHVLGACEAGASMRENVHQLRRARAYRKQHGGPLEAALSAVQVSERCRPQPRTDRRAARGGRAQDRRGPRPHTSARASVTPSSPSMDRCTRPGSSATSSTPSTCATYGCTASTSPTLSAGRSISVPTTMAGSSPTSSPNGPAPWQALRSRAHRPGRRHVRARPRVSPRPSG